MIKDKHDLPKSQVKVFDRRVLYKYFWECTYVNCDGFEKIFVGFFFVLFFKFKLETWLGMTGNQVAKIQYIFVSIYKCVQNMPLL